MGLFGLFGDAKARKKKEYEKTLSLIDDRLRTTHDQIAKVKKRIEKITYAMKVKFTEMEGASGILRDQLERELRILDEKLTMTQQRFKALNSVSRTLESEKVKVEELIAIIDTPDGVDIGKETQALEYEYARIAQAAEQAKLLRDTYYEEDDMDDLTTRTTDDIKERIGLPRQDQPVRETRSDMNTASADSFTEQMRRRLATLE